MLSNFVDSAVEIRRYRAAHDVVTMMAQTTATVNSSQPKISQPNFSETWTFFDGAWHEGNVPIMGPRTHATWLGSVVFDGARAFEGVAPDLDRHCARVNQSAINFKLTPVGDTATWIELAREGMARFDAK